MKLKIILLPLLLAFVWTTVNAQSKYQQLKEPVQFNANVTSASDLMETLQRQTGYSFYFDNRELSRITLRRLHFDKAPLGNVLEFLNDRYGLGFLVTGKKIAVSVERPVTPTPVTISGRVTEADRHMPLAGVTISIRDSRQATTTDSGGTFRIRAPDQDAILIISYTGYEKLEIKIAEKTYFNIVLQRDVRSLGAVTVQARRKVDNENSLLNERKNSAVVSDGISAQQMEKTASITTTQALQRVSGVTITDDKYVAIRGLGDRSVVAELNGIRLSSANPDRSSVPLDLVPAALLDNVTIYKTLTPDRPADASAGIIELKTRSIPDSLTVSFTAQGGFNSTIGLTGKFNAFRNYDLGYFGQKVQSRDLPKAFTDLNTQYPGGLTEIQQLFIQSRGSQELTTEALRINKIMWSFDPVVTTSYQQAQPNRIFTASAGNTFKIFHGHDLGVILSANYYHRTEDRYQAELTRWSIDQGIVTGSPLIYNPLHAPPFSNPDALYLGKYLSYKENTGTETVSYGGLASVTYKINALNEVNFQYLGSKGAEATGKNLTGSYDNTGFDYPVYDQVNMLQQMHRTFNTYNLQGEHKLFDRSWAPKISYNLASSRSVQDEPDYRFSDIANAHRLRFQDANGVGAGDDTYVFVVGTVHGIGPSGVIVADPNGRRYRKLAENNHNYKADLTETFNLFGNKQELKFGYNYLKRDRTFTENELGLPGTLAGGDNGLLQKVDGQLDELVSAKYVGLRDQSEEIGAPRVGGFLYQIYKTPNNYQGYYKTQAFYGMLDTRLFKRFRLTGGVRFESTDIRANVDTANVFTGISLAGNNLPTQSSGNTLLNPNTGYKVDFKPFYSANLTYTYHTNMNFRLAYNTTLARPELREITNVYEFDPAQFAVVIGNPSLVNQFTKSADFRWEWFPSPGEVLSASVFGKFIKHQLTKTFSYNSQGNLATNPEYPVVKFENDPEPGKVYGVELEIRKNLGGLLRPLQNFFLGCNVMLASSVVKKNAARLDASRTMDRFAPAESPLFEQAPYAINTYLDYSNPRSGTTITASFNEIGERLVQVQLDGTPDLFDRPVPVLDFVFSQRLGKRFLIKGFAKNVLNPPYRTVYAIPGNGGEYRGHTYINHQYYRGMEVALGLTFKLF